VSVFHELGQKLVADLPLAEGTTLVFGGLSEDDVVSSISLSGNGLPERAMGVAVVHETIPMMFETRHEDQETALSTAQSAFDSLHSYDGTIVVGGKTTGRYLDIVATGPQVRRDGLRKYIAWFNFLVKREQTA
jgi:hypothetical protein